MVKQLLFLLLTFTLIIGCERESSNPENLNEHFIVETQGAYLPVQVEGNLASNQLIIMLHGGPGGDAQAYNIASPTFSKAMEERVAMVYYDQRGSGSSSGQYAARDLTIDQHVRDLNRIIDALKTRYGNEREIILMGHSWGGALGTAFLLQPGIQSTIKGWIEVDGAHNFSGTEAIVQQFERIGQEMIDLGSSVDFWNESLDFVRNLDPSSDADLTELNSLGFRAEQYLGQDGYLSGEDLTEAYRELDFYSKHDKNRAASNLLFTSSGFGMYDEVINLDYTEQLSNIKIPTLLLWGAYDMVVPPTLGREAYQKLGTPNNLKQIVVFSTSGHSPMVNEPKAFTNAVFRWLDRLP